MKQKCASKGVNQSRFKAKQKQQQHVRNMSVLQVHVQCHTQNVGEREKVRFKRFLLSGGAFLENVPYSVLCVLTGA